jgi:FixJ family two-component response regulator
MTREEVEAKLLLRTLEAAERLLLAGIAGGQSLPAIAASMGITDTQAEKLKSNMLRKVGRRSTADLARIGVCAGLGSLAAGTRSR